MTNNCRASLLALMACLSINGAVAQTTEQGSDAARRIAGLEERVERAEALRAVKRLQFAYGQYVEFGLWQDFADLFADDAVAYYMPEGLGREEVRALFLDQVGQGKLGLDDGRLYPHFVLQPVVTLDPDGRTAHGRWHLLTLLGGLGGNATWVGNVYENTYVLENGVWKIGELHTYTQFSGSYAAGWTDPPVQTGAAQQSGICENYLINDCTIAFHYDAALAGNPTGTILKSLIASESEGDAATVELDTLSAHADALDLRVSRLLDESAVRNLQHAYGYYFDRRLWNDVADLFTTGATFELGLQGVYRGQASIRRMLEQFGAEGIGAGEVDDHLQLETIVTVAPDGKTATARGVDFALKGAESDGAHRAEWREAVFVNTYVNENGVWKIAAVHLYPRFATDYALGWAEDARPAPTASEEFPPDEPPTVMHGVYPEFYVPPFPFLNPVTGAPPQYPDGMPFPEDEVSIPTATNGAGNSAPRRDDAGGDSMAALSAHLDDIHRRIDIAIGYDAVENLANAFNFTLDEFDEDAAGEIFVAGAEVTVNNAEVAGNSEPVRGAINASFAGASGGRPHGLLAIHQTLQPVIDIAQDGASAKIRFRLFEPAGRINEPSVWIAGIYEADAVEQGGAWRLDQASINLSWAAEYKEGWASAAPFAEIANVPFHYDNAVSGRKRPTGSGR